MPDEIARYCAEIDRCNQRGGRMLSIVDLVNAGTMTPELAAYSIAAVGGGASFMVGALPGGAGKTTVMGALLGLTPRATVLTHADDLAAARAAAGEGRRVCCICHEIGDGPYFGYLWGDNLRAYFDLQDAGCTLATNLHADTADQIVDQVVRQNRVPEARLNRVELLYFLCVRWLDRQVERRVHSVWESCGDAPHRCLYRGGEWVGVPSLVGQAQIASAREQLPAIVAAGARTVEEVRTALYFR